jgi:hypothetical protein
VIGYSFLVISYRFLVVGIIDKKEFIMNPTKDSDYYMKLGYRIKLIPEKDRWAVILPDIEDCVGAGDTTAEALRCLKMLNKVGLLAALNMATLFLCQRAQVRPPSFA